MDYVSNTFMLTFSPSENIEMQCFKVGIINDEVIELTEQFSVKLISATPEGSFIDDTSCISIIDNDRKCIICESKTIMIIAASSVYVYIVMVAIVHD